MASKLCPGEKASPVGRGMMKRDNENRFQSQAMRKRGHAGLNFKPPHRGTRNTADLIQFTLYVVA